MSIHKKTVNLAERLAAYTKQLNEVEDVRIEGTLTRVVGLKLEAIGFSAPLGSKCLIQTVNKKYLEAEVVGFSDNIIYLMTSDTTHGVSPGAKVIPTGNITQVAVSEELLGRVLDGSGNPLDGGSDIRAIAHYPLMGEVMNPLQRHMIENPLNVGIRAINALLTIGLGQRIGLFATSGVGKSMLLGMMTKYTSADVIVVGLIGERGREVKEFIEHILGAEGMKRAVVITAPADTSPLMRVHGALRATAVAEYFRDQGYQVLLLLDSLTRFAQAQRELSLSIGEPPATRGYTPSVFAKLSQLVERAGTAAKGHGSITAFYTVLTEGDMENDPVAESARAILDGHIVLSKELADSGHYPAINIETSISRVMQNVTNEQHRQAAIVFKSLYSRYMQNRDLIKMGAYAAGSDPELEIAIKLFPKLTDFLTQGFQESVNFADSLQQLLTLINSLPSKSDPSSLNPLQTHYGYGKANNEVSTS
ncbi:MAG: FliI/YscN family ATPase [Legionellales bacterium]|nr:FliI/YscN family ATPase [Legionellales bacterium]